MCSNVQPDELNAGNLNNDDLPQTRAVAHVWSLKTTRSTNATAERLITSGQWPRDGMTIVAAREQTAGRGRLDHTWFSAPGESFTATFVSAVGAGVAHDPTLNGWLQMIAGVSVLDALRETLQETNLRWVADPVNADGSTDDVKLKWPNDIVFHGRKLGGILAQTVTLPDDPATVAVIFGVGLNIAVPQDDLPIDAATSWHLITEPVDEGGRPDAARVADLLAARIVRDLEGRLWQFGLNPHGYARNLRKRVTEECWTLGRPILVHYMDGSTRNGIARAIDADASLAMTDDNGAERLVRTGDVGVLPVGD
ncbi:biotin--[acetyl-CoA-carboxylase] ligase [Bifidobacterium pseudolongum subsp. globosum]|uniref:Biotin--[acetyl-CoA-carboxylase] ligase n=1 Tax=Bifidobacterium pseudolongum subsp. globosum TaxID=1690 RepID=A0A4V1Y1X1_9BIFI|nr:biotin--[acetyl-CoA-carboxylase] ligase [Bifidobacterium pseudolongum]RYQ11640.1 biotin--[acetyl-CoA-carboxylase] ligase [Bifidobacterium pseudolongum subsp. globosum]